MWKSFVFIAICAASGVTNGKSIVSKTADLLDSQPINFEPMIGILSLEQSYYLDGKYPGQFASYIAASYVKFVEGGGARVVPIW